MTDDQHTFTSIDSWLKAQVPAKAPQARACADFASRMNRVDSSLAELFAPECHHESQTRLAAIKGRDDVAKYFLGWVDRPIPLAFAELATDPQNGEPCVLMSVRDSTYGRPGLGEVRSYITFQLNADDLIQASFAVSLAPDPRACLRSGIFAGLSEEELRREQERVGQQLPRTGRLELLLFVLPELESEADSYLSMANDVASELDLPSPHVQHLLAGDERASRLGVVAHPTVVLAHDGQRVRLLEGVLSKNEMRKALSASLGIAGPDGNGSRQALKPLVSGRLPKRFVDHVYYCIERDPSDSKVRTMLANGAAVARREGVDGKLTYSNEINSWSEDDGRQNWIGCLREEHNPVPQHECRLIPILGVAWWTDGRGRRHVCVRGGGGYIGEYRQPVWLNRSVWRSCSPGDIFPEESAWARVHSDRSERLQVLRRERKARKDDRLRLAREEAKSVKLRQPIAPCTEDGKSKTFDGAPWTDFFSSSRGTKCTYFVKGSGVLDESRPHEVWLAILALARRVANEKSELSSYNPGSGVTSIERRFDFLDGGFESYEGNYTTGRRGAWIMGVSCLRFICFHLGIGPPKRTLKGEISIPSEGEIRSWYSLDTN